MSTGTASNSSTGTACLRTHTYVELLVPVASLDSLANRGLLRVLVVSRIELEVIAGNKLYTDSDEREK
jgi:hypothetical protein